MKKLTIKAFRLPYDTGHLSENGESIINDKIDCSDKDMNKLHNHYADGYDYLLNYWTNYWQKSPFASSSDDLLSGALRYHPSRIRDKKTGKKKSSYGVKRLTHHYDFQQDGKYYTHEHMFNMMNKKIGAKYPGAKHTLAHWNEGQYMRWNTYVKWAQEFDKSFNNGLKVNDLEQCKVTVQWLRDDIPVNAQ
mgnify:FL=1|tara:strand:- start:1031 stop:1603 length:573 start_codon:yes stop_codon:yes gene_type:complete